MNKAIIPPPKDLPGIEIHFCELDDDSDVSIETALGVLSEAEASRAMRFRFDRDRNRFVRGRGFMRHVLGMETGCRPSELPLTEGLRGKPELAASGVHFNLSNSANLAVLAIRREGPVGIDLEFSSRDVNEMTLARSCMQDHEIAAIEAMDGPARRELFFSFWTAKEALMKCTGEGFLIDPRKISLDLDDGRPIGFRSPASAVAIRLSRLSAARPLVVCSVAWSTSDLAAV